MSKEKEKYNKSCKPNDEGTGVQCIAYIPDKQGGKQVVANAEFIQSPDGSLSTNSHDGRPDAIDELEEHARKHIKKKSSGEF